VLKKLAEFNKRLTKPLIIINIILLILDLSSIVMVEDHDFRVKFLKYMGFHTLTLILLVYSLETIKPSKEE